MNESSKGAPTEHKQTPIPILLLGDWVVDENWVLARHQPLLSSIEGSAHLRALGGIQSRFMTFCGAGRVARCLYWFNRFNDPKFIPGDIEGTLKEIRAKTGDGKKLRFNLICLGIWHQEDESQLYRMFHPLHTFGINSFTLTHSSVVTRTISPLELFSQLDGLAINTLASACREHEVGTTRIYRLFQQKPEAVGGVELDRRADFELRFVNRAAEGDRLYDQEKLRENLEKLKGELTFSAPTPKESEDQQSILNALKSIIATIEGTGSIDPKEIRSNLYNANRLLTNAVRKSTKTAPRITGPLSYAVIKDLGKGTVTPLLLDALADSELIDVNTRWFISSKRAQPRWLEFWKKTWGRISLWFVPPKAIAQLAFRESPDYVKKKRHQLKAFPTDWFVRGQRPSQEAMKGLETLLEMYFSKAEDVTIVAMPRGLSILGVHKEHHNRRGFYQADAILSDTEAELAGRASMFFAALLSEMIHRAEGASMESRDEQRDPFSLALGAARAWVDAEINHLKSFDDEKQGSTLTRVIGYDPSLAGHREEMARHRVREFDWKSENDDWEAALSSTGLIERNGHLHLDIWRAMCHLDGYVETVERRQSDISMLIRRLKEFADERYPDQALSALLIAKPGSGKSYLVSRLARTLDMLPLNFNITQLVTREDLIACFDVIASTQAQEPRAELLVFFDEINSLVIGTHIYDLFLSVLEDGAYLRNGQLFKLKPCVWFFAGTEPLLSHQEAKKVMKSDKKLYNQYVSSKAPDLHSRLTIKSVELDATPAELRAKDEIRRGFLYQGALQLQNRHSDIKKISLDVLLAFYLLEVKTSIRRIRHYAKHFNDVQYGEVKCHNMPSELRDVLGRNPRSWHKLRGSREKPEKLVQIHRQPDWPELDKP